MKKIVKKIIPYSALVFAISVVNQAQTLLVSIFKLWDIASSKEFKNIYMEQVSQYTNSNLTIDQQYIMPEWQHNLDVIDNYFKSNFSFNFLRHHVIGATMFIGTIYSWKNNQLAYLEKIYPKSTLKKILKEISVGSPMIADLKYRTSSNSIHHLYHLAKFSIEAKVPLESIQTIIEFGAGYGNLIRIFKKINPDSTCILIDLPVFSFIQSVYLKTVFGKTNVNVIIDKKTQIKRGAINIIPFNLDILNNLSSEKPDLFLSTWALSETTSTMQKEIKSLNYFNATYLLMAYQQADKNFKYAEDVAQIGASYRKIYNKETEYMRNNYYLFSIKS